MHKIFFESIRGPVTCLGVTGTTSIHTAMRTQDAAIRHEIGVTSPQSQTKRQTPNAARKNKCHPYKTATLEAAPFAYCPARACFLHLGDLGSCATGLGLGRNCANKTVCVCHWVEGPQTHTLQTRRWTHCQILKLSLPARARPAYRPARARPAYRPAHPTTGRTTPRGSCLARPGLWRSLACVCGLSRP